MNFSGQNNPFFIPLSELEGNKLEDLISSSDYFVTYPIEQVYQFFWRILSILKSSSIKNRETVEIYHITEFDQEINMALNPTIEDQLNEGFYKDILLFIEDYYIQIFYEHISVKYNCHYLIANKM